ncbi:MAG: NAD(P)-dependent oxidoreductase [Parvibaculaceae bacterium]
MKIALFGASGKTGGLILERALAAGHNVTALARDAGKLRPRDHLHIVTGNAREAGAVAGTVRGAEIVISALSSGGDTLAPFGRHVIACMEQAGVTRIVSLLGASVTMTGDPHTLPMAILRMITRAFAGKDMLMDGAAHAQALAASSLDYTLIRPPRLSDGPASGHIRHGATLNLSPASVITRADLADFMLKVAIEGIYVRAAPMVAECRQVHLTTQAT